MSTYRDFNLSFKPHPVTGDLVMLNDVRAIMQAVKTLIHLKEEEILMSPEMDGGVAGVIFELNTPLLQYNISKKIQDVILNYEPRIDITDISVVSTSQHAVTISLTFYFLNQEDTITDTITLNRLR